MFMGPARPFAAKLFRRLKHRATLDSSTISQIHFAKLPNGLCLGQSIVAKSAQQRAGYGRLAGHDEYLGILERSQFVEEKIDGQALHV